MKYLCQTVIILYIINLAATQSLWWLVVLLFYIDSTEKEKERDYSGGGMRSCGTRPMRPPK